MIQIENLLFFIERKLTHFLRCFWREGRLDLRRAKRRNTERLTVVWGGLALNSLGGPNPDCFGCARLVYEHPSEEKKFTLVEKVNGHCFITLLILGSNKHTPTQIKGAIINGLRANKNAFDGGCVVPGAGGVDKAMKEVLAKHKPRTQLRGQAFTDTLLIIPKFLFSILVLNLWKH